MSSSTVEISIPTAADGQGILGLTSNIELFEPGDVRIIEELWTEFVTKREQSWYHFLIARIGEEIGGFACYGRRPLTESSFDLYWIGVSQQFQDQGIGKKLLKRVEDEVRHLGAKLLIIETAGKPIFEPTRQFYLRAGYDLEARVRDFYSPGDDLVIFTKHF